MGMMGQGANPMMMMPGMNPQMAQMMPSPMAMNNPVS